MKAEPVSLATLPSRLILQVILISYGLSSTGIWDLVITKVKNKKVTHLQSETTKNQLVPDTPPFPHAKCPPFHHQRFLLLKCTVKAKFS